MVQAAAAFAAEYGRTPSACGVGPARVEILGNHTDYNGGSVLTAAIDRYVVAVGRPAAAPVVRVRSLNFSAAVEFRLDELVPGPPSDWSNYVKAVFAGLREAGVQTGGMDLVFAADVPVGAGLSSSAAFETALAMLILQAHPHPLDRLELARRLQRGEHDFAGVRCGLLDQFSSLFGEDDRLLMLDCGSSTHELLTLPSPSPALVLCHCGVTRALGRDAPYNVRRAECEQAAERLASLLRRPVANLCAVSSVDLERVESELAEPWRSRASHVIGEHERVLAAGAHLRAGELQAFGRLLTASHESSRDQFENSCPALDRLWAAAVRQPGCWGSRLCGAGWGGCTVSLVRPEAVEAFLAAMRAEAAVGEIHVCWASRGAEGHPL